MGKGKGKVVALVAVLLTAVVGCGAGGEPDFAACKQALKSQIASDQPVYGDQRWKRPASCEGVNDQTLQTMATEAFMEKMKEDIDKEATPTG